VLGYVASLRALSRMPINWHVGTQEDFTPLLRVLPLPPGTPGLVAGGVVVIGKPTYGVIKYDVIDSGDSLATLAVGILLGANAVGATEAVSTGGRLIMMPGAANAAQGADLGATAGVAEESAAMGRVA